jgi:predicted tellurium resistance membrane protein TerC
MLELLVDPNAWLAFATLAALEIVLGIDNLIFISILAARLPLDQQARARRVGIAAALVSRLALLFALTWIMKLTAPLFAVAGNEFSGKDLVLIFGGLFLIYKATREIHDKLEGSDEAPGGTATPATSFTAMILQMMVIDIVFSLDSIITAVGMVDELAIMVAAIIAAVVFMFVFSGTVHGFVNRHPTIKMLALAFLFVIGLVLIVDGFGFHIPKGYIYSAMTFAIVVELLNMRLRRRGLPVHLHGPEVQPAPVCRTCGQPLPATASSADAPV